MHQVLQAVNFRFKVADDKGEMHEATEWYQVQLEIIDSIIQKIMNGTIIYFAYNKEQQCLEQRIEKKNIAVKSVGLEGFDADYREGIFRGDCIWCEDRGVPFAEADHA